MQDRIGTGRSSRWLMTALAVGSLASFVFVCIHRGIWLDEVWSLYMARHDLPLSLIYDERWSYDIQPPLFYFSAWLFEPLTGEDIAARRLVNLLWIAVAAASFFALSRWRPQARNFLLIFAVLAGSNSFVWMLIAEHRSYAAQISAVAVIYAALFTVLFYDGSDYDRSERPILIVLGLAILVGSNLHYLSSVGLGTILFASIVLLWLRHCRRWAVRVLAVCVLSYAVLAFCAVSQMDRVGTVSQNFWVKTSTPEAIGMLGLVIGSAVMINVPAVLLSLGYVVGAGRKRAIERNVLHVLVYTLLALLLTSLVLLILNHVKPVLLTRYLTPMALLPIASIAFILANRIVSRRWFDLLLINAIVLVAAVAAFKGTGQQWNGLGAIIGQEVAHCPSTRVIAVPPWVWGGYEHSFHMRNEPDVIALGYETVGKRFGFHPTRGTEVATIGPDCPTIVWTEHYFVPPPPPDMVAHFANVRLPAAGSYTATTRVSRTGYMVAYRPVHR